MMGFMKVLLSLLFLNISTCFAKSVNENNVWAAFEELEDGENVARALTPTKLTPAEIQTVVEMHNDFRRSQGSSDMRSMTWNDDLAAMAQTWADTCNLFHGHPSENPTGYSTVRQNIYMYGSMFGHVGAFDVTRGVNWWYDEVQYYDIARSPPCESGKTCGHYTAMVWADTNQVGCGVTKCSPMNISPTRTNRGTYWYLVCNYIPPGNVGGLPFKVGPACSACRPGESCLDGAFCN